MNKVEHILGNSIKEVLKVEGQVRPDKEKGHEHFVSLICLVFLHTISDQ